ncbi:MAG: U32 family peptidase [Nitrospirae bacterium]|nr:U32 family peptidase [Nitrospirota bacterium]
MSKRIGDARIVAPVCSLDDALGSIEAGADELYCGVMFDDWIERFGEADLISRRQGRYSHISSKDELQGIVNLTMDAGKKIGLTLNVQYCRSQYNLVLDLIRMWEDMGGHYVIVSDIGILLELQGMHSGLIKHLSLMAGVFNSMSVAFFREFNISRVVLPRDLTVEEMKSIHSASGDMEFECLVINQKCQFIDSMCGFHHNLTLSDDMVVDTQYNIVPGCVEPVIYTHDPMYEGHGCKLCYETKDGKVHHIYNNDFLYPHCAACLLAELCDAGVSFFKIAGRAYPTDIIVRSIRFIKKACSILTSHKHPPPASVAMDIQQLYSQTFDIPCDNTRCYYLMA